MFGVLSALTLTVSPADATPTFPVGTIDPTGTSDVTAQLQAFIADVPDGSTISFPAGARYRVDGSLIVEGRKNLTFEGHGAEFVATTEADRSRRHWWIRNSDGITIRDVVVRGANPSAGTGDAAYRSDREAQHGFDFAGVTNVVLEHVRVSDVFGDFVYIGIGKRGLSKDVTIRDSTFERSGRQGIAITGGEDVRVERNSISQVRRSTFDIEPNGPTWGARRVTIADNDIGPGRLNFLAGQGSAAPVEDIVVSGNRLKGKPMNVSLKAPSSKRRSNFALVGNVSDTAFGSSTAAITIQGFDGVTIRDNVVPLAARRNMTAVRLTSTCGAVVEGNDFTNAATEVASDGYRCDAVSTSQPSNAPAPSAPAGSAPAPEQGQGPADARGQTATSSSPSGDVAAPPSRNGSLPEPGAATVDYASERSGPSIWLAVIAAAGAAVFVMGTHRLVSRSRGRQRRDPT